MTERASLVIACLVVLCSAGIGAQGFMRRGRAPLREPTAQSFDGGFNFCRGMYTSVRRNPSGTGWTTDYPDADINFSIRLSELTKTKVSRRPDGEPNHLTLRLTSDDLFNCPSIHMEDMGSAELIDEGYCGFARISSRAGFCGLTTSGGAQSGTPGSSRSRGSFQPPSIRSAT